MQLEDVLDILRCSMCKGQVDWSEFEDILPLDSCVTFKDTRNMVFQGRVKEV